MTEDATPGTDASRRNRRRYALEHAAAVHERAAATHDDAAALYERLGLHDKAAIELEKAARERLGATTDRNNARDETPDADLQ